MTDRPIIFSAPMIRALLEGRKTQTRRLAWRRAPKGYLCTGVVATDITGQQRRSIPLASPWRFVKSGDRLWVREGWKPHSLYDHMAPREMPQAKVFYLADEGYSPSGSRGRPSIHMPRRASRLTLMVTAARMERLQAISEFGAVAEGIEAMEGQHGGKCWRNYGAPMNPDRSPRYSFRTLWESIHGPGAWDTNPEVVALTFTVDQRNIDAEQPHA